MTNLFSFPGRRPAHWPAHPLAALALLLATAGAAQAQGPTFAPVVTTGTSSSPYAVAVADVNSDGKPDALVLTRTSNLLNVFLGDGAGGFTLQTPSYGTGASSINSAVGLAVADVNSDGKPDALAVNNIGGTLSVLLGNGAGGFVLHSPLPFTNYAYVPSSSGGPYAVAVADVNHDGKPDALVANSNSSTLGVLLGDGAGGFTIFSPPSSLSTSTGPSSNPISVAVADVNGDGHPDALTANSNSSTMGVLLGDGTGNFTLRSGSPVSGTPIPGSTVTSPFGVVIADLNNDGKPDALLANTVSRSLGVLLGDGAGGFTLRSNTLTGLGGPNSVAVADVNGDGYLDALTTDSYAGALGVLLGDGTGGFVLQSTPSTGPSSSPRAVTAADVNGDGVPDALVANMGSSTLGVLLNTTGQPLLATLSPTSGAVGTSVTLTGTFLSGTTAVRFGSTPATAFTVVNATTITTTVPAGASSGLVTVTNTRGTSNGLAFTVTPSNNALAFDGTDDEVQTATTAPAFGTGAFTLEAWVRCATTSTTQVTVALGSVGGSNDYWLGQNAGRATVSVSGAACIGTSLITDNRWHHLAGVRSGSQLTIYVDGVAQNTVTTANLASPTSPLSIGSFGNSYFWQGSLDEVRLYSAGLTASQVQADMFSTAPALPASQVAYYNFDQGSAGGTNTGLTTLTDQSGNGNNGTLNTFALSGTTSNWVRSFPTITGIAPTTGPIGTSVSLTGTNLLDATNFKFNGTAVAPFATPTNDLVATVTVPMGASTGPLSVASATLTVYNGPVFTVTYPDLVISTPGQSIAASAYNSITVNSGGTATLAGTVVVNSFVAVNNGGTLNDGCFSIGGAGSFTLAAGGTLGICDVNGLRATGNSGPVRVTGTRSFSPDAGYVYNGTAPQETGSGLPAQVHNLTTTNASPVTLSAATSVAQVLTVGGSGNLVTGGLPLTLLSSSAGTALVVNSGTGVVSGTATMQRYIDASGNTSTSGYRHYSTPVSGATVGGLATPGFAPVVNSAYNTAAYTLAVAPYPTVYGYDQSRVGNATLATNLSAFDQGYVSPAALTDALVVGQGYTVQIGNTEKVSFTGTLNNGPRSITGLQRNANGSGGWQLVGNPYPAPLDWGTVGTGGSGLANVNAAVYVFQSTSDYAGIYRSFVNNVGAGTNVLAAGQGFFVRVSTPGTPGSITLTNANRATSYGPTPAFQRATAETRPLLRLSLGLGSQPATSATAQDETFVYFQAGATSAFDGTFDANKLLNPSGYYLGTASADATAQGLSISGRALLPQASPDDVVPLWLSVPAGSYTLTATELLNFAGMAGGTTVLLRDALTSSLTNLGTTPSYSFQVAANAAYAGRFSLVFRASTALAMAPAGLLGQILTSVYPNPTAGPATLSITGLPAQVRQVQATVVDALGRVADTLTLTPVQGAATAMLPTQGLSAGVYVLRLSARDDQGQVVSPLPAQRLSVR
jgi:hypothetical protein